MQRPMVSTKDSNIVNTVSRLQACASMDHFWGERKWLDILGITKRDYKAFLQEQRPLSDTSITSLADYLDVSADEIQQGTVDFRAVSTQKGDGDKVLPEPYSIAAFGRLRTTITSFDYIEERLGWRVRADTLRHFRINEAVLSDYMAPTNMRVITDLALYMQTKHNMSDSQLFHMGMHSSVGNRNTLIGAVLSTARDITEAYAIYIDELAKFFENNLRYTITLLREDRCTLEAVSYRYVAEALGVRHLGNKQVCAIRAGMLASVPHYLDQPQASVTEPLCVHRGDSVCRYEIKFPHVASL